MHRHTLDPLSLIPGIVFACLGLVFLYGDINVLRLDWSWVWPAAAVLVGLALLLSLRPQPQPEDSSAGDQPEDLEPLE